MRDTLNHKYNETYLNKIALATNKINKLILTNQQKTTSDHLPVSSYCIFEYANSLVMEMIVGV